LPRLALKCVTRLTDAPLAVVLSRSPVRRSCWYGPAASPLVTQCRLAAPVRVVPLTDLERVTAPAWALLTPPDVAALAVRKPNIRLVLHAVIPDKAQARTVEIWPQ